MSSDDTNLNVTQLFMNWVGLVSCSLQQLYIILLICIPFVVNVQCVCVYRV